MATLMESYSQKGLCLQFATFIFFAACVVVMTLTVAFLLPETKNVPIEEVMSI